MSEGVAAAAAAAADAEGWSDVFELARKDRQEADERDEAATAAECEWLARLLQEAPRESEFLDAV